jgi:hypothetical protein
MHELMPQASIDARRNHFHRRFYPYDWCYTCSDVAMAWRCDMKTRLLMVLILFALSVFVLPSPGQAGHGHGGGSGWYWAGGFLGGLFLGSALYGPYYAPRPVYVYPSPPVVYAPPAPVYVYPAPRYGYTYPNPGYSEAPPDSEQNREADRGEWITVPGQWVKGRWVPEHKAWVPNTTP